MNIVVMGTGPFAVPMFKALADSSHHQVAVVVTRPSRGGKSRQAIVNPMREAAEALSLDVYDPESINSDEGHAILRRYDADVFVVCDYGQILSADTLSLSRLGGINLHGSLLPKYRGAAPVQWALLNGDAETGVTVIHMTPKMDAGPILAVRRVEIGAVETHEQLEPRLAELGVEPVLESLESLASWDGASPIGEPQDASLTCRAPRLKKADGEIDWTRSSHALHNQVRALQPWPGAFTFIPRRKGDPQRLLVTRLQAIDETELAEDQLARAPGQVVASDRERLWVRTGDGAVSIVSIQPAGKRKMEIVEFLRGFQPEPGLKLGGA